MRKTRVYIAGPITKGNQFLNVKAAIDVADKLLRYGYAPYCPHFTCFWQMHYPHPYQEWMDLDFEWLRACDAVLRLYGESVGADREVQEASRLGIKVVNRRAIMGNNDALTRLRTAVPRYTQDGEANAD
jgi:hypothetical protein